MTGGATKTILNLFLFSAGGLGERLAAEEDIKTCQTNEHLQWFS